MTIAGRVDVAGHDARLEKDARADDVGDDDGDRGEQAEAADEGDVVARAHRAGGPAGVGGSSRIRMLRNDAASP